MLERALRLDTNGARMASRIGRQKAYSARGCIETGHEWCTKGIIRGVIRDVIRVLEREHLVTKSGRGDPGGTGAGGHARGGQSSSLATLRRQGQHDDISPAPQRDSPPR